MTRKISDETTQARAALQETARELAQKIEQEVLAQLQALLNENNCELIPGFDIHGDKVQARLRVVYKG